MTDKLRAAAELALEALDSCDAAHPSDGGQQWYDSKAVDAAITALRTALAEQPAEQEPVGLPLVVAGAVFDFAGYITTRSKVIEVGSTANAGPVADLVKEWAKLRGLSLDDAAVLSWQEWLPTAPQPAKQPLTDEEIIRAAISTQSAEPGRDGYVLPVTFARAVIAAYEAKNGIGEQK